MGITGPALALLDTKNLLDLLADSPEQAAAFMASVLLMLYFLYFFVMTPRLSLRRGNKVRRYNTKVPRRIKETKDSEKKPKRSYDEESPARLRNAALPYPKTMKIPTD